MKRKKAAAEGRAKIADIHARIIAAVTRGDYIVSNHAYERAQDRLIPIPHVEYVLTNGFHEKRKDTYKEEFSAWNYAVRGKTPDRVNARIIVTFTEDDLLVVTVINLDL